MLGILILLAVGYAIYSLTADMWSADKAEEIFGGRAYDEAKYLVSLLAKVAKSDGRVNELEARLIKEILDDLTAKLGGDAVKRAELKLIYKREKENLANAYEIAREYQSKFRLSKSAAVSKMAVLISLAYVDGHLSADERNLITQIALGMRVGGAELSMLFAQFDAFYAGQKQDRFKQWQNERQSRGDKRSDGWEFANGYDEDVDLDQGKSRRGSGYGGSDFGSGQAGSNGGSSGGANNGASAKTKAKSPYDVLGLSEGAAFSEVKKRYRELVKKYHPDILMGQGESNEIIEKSTRKLQEINEAYEAIRQRAA